MPASHTTIWKCRSVAPAFHIFAHRGPPPCPGQPFENGHATNPHRRQQTLRQPDGRTGKSGPAPKSLKNILQGRNGKQLVPPRGYDLNVDNFVGFLKSGVEAHNAQK